MHRATVGARLGAHIRRKTVCAEYAIATSLRDQQRVLYTSPIKALSNQKYRELKEEFGDVGLMTGDVTIDVDASCLVMTTEILRSMLYRGSEVMREVKWVIFDEVHYMRDKERGVVWEEVMILLPPSVRYVFLSATIPNALEFAEWIAQLHSQPCHVVYTGYRPTPLTHFIFPQGGQGMYQIVDEKAVFKADQFTKAIAAIVSKPQVHGDGGGRGGGGRGNRNTERGGGGGGRGKGGGKGGGEPSDCFKLVQLVVAKGYDPLIVFAFGKNKCEKLAMEMRDLHLNTPQETEMVEQIFKNAVDTLTEDDQALPQVVDLLPMISRGIAVHHSGLLPVLKELVEILFQENLVKLLFATETFAMGLNMPARTVLFAELSKFDGSGFRYLSSGEYIQMSGRAGRRGLDTRGVVVQMIDDKTDTGKVREMLTGKADVLSSKFHLGYNMLLNCVRVETVDVEMLISKSFYTFQQQKALPQLRSEHQVLVDQLSSSADLIVENREVVAELHGALYNEATLKDELRSIVNKPIHSLPFLQSGRLCQVRAAAPSSEEYNSGAGLGEDWGWCIIVDFKKRGSSQSGEAIARKAKKGEDAGGPIENVTVDVLMRCASGAEEAIAEGSLPKPAPPLDASAAAAKGGSSSEEVEMHVVTVPLAHVDRLSAVKIKLPQDLRSSDSRYSMLKVLKEVSNRFKDGVPLLQPVDEMKVSDERIPKLMRRLETAEAKVNDERFKEAPVKEALPILRKRLAVGSEERLARGRIKEVEAVLMKDELRARRRVLRRLGHLSEDGVIQNKGRVACELSTADELLTTELVFSGLLNELDPGPMAALLSCLVSEGKGSKGGSGQGGGGKTGKGGKEPDPATLIKTRSMVEPFEKLREHARRVASTMKNAIWPSTRRSMSTASRSN